MKEVTARLRDAVYHRYNKEVVEIKASFLMEKDTNELWFIGTEVCQVIPSVKDTPYEQGIVLGGQKFSENSR